MWIPRSTPNMFAENRNYSIVKTIMDIQVSPSASYYTFIMILRPVFLKGTYMCFVKILRKISSPYPHIEAKVRNASRRYNRTWIWSKIAKTGIHSGEFRLPRSLNMGYQLQSCSWYFMIPTLLSPIENWCCKYIPWICNIQYPETRIDYAMTGIKAHDDVIKWKHFPRYWPFVQGIHRSPVDYPHKGQCRGALMFSLICALIND